MISSQTSAVLLQLLAGTCQQMGSEIKLLQIFALRIFFSALKNSEVTLFFFFPPEIEIWEVLPVLWDPTKERKRCHNTGSPDAPAISA